MDQRKVGNKTWKFENEVRIIASAVAVGPDEAKGPLVKEFDVIHDDLYAGQETWEKAERKLFEDAVKEAIKKSGVEESEVELLLGGDLLNQIISATFTARTVGYPYIGMYGACSTSMLTLSTAAALVNAGYVSGYAVAGCCSHNATAERQYRYPTEYGGQKPGTAQYTVTGAGAAVIGIGGKGPRITHATIGKIVDYGLKNPFDMGSAMAPAAVDTISAHFEDTGRSPQDYDLIVTGDLASVGLPIAKRLLKDKGIDMGNRFHDCGLMIYYRDKQPVFAGASGCASSAVVTYSHIVNALNQGKYKRVLVVATGALLSPVTYQQGESIPCIAHAVAIESE